MVPQHCSRMSCDTYCVKKTLDVHVVLGMWEVTGRDMAAALSPAAGGDVRPQPCLEVRLV